MKEFFEGWRRKAGLVTLVMACVVCSFWVRSAKWEDDLTVRATTDQTIAIRTYDIGIGVWWLWGLDEDVTNGYAPLPRWIKWTTIDHTRQFGVVAPLFETLKEQSLFGFSALRMTAPEDEAVGLQALIIPYYFPSLGLTLLSAYLLYPTSRKQPAATSRPHA